MDGIEASTKIREYEQENGLQPSSIMAVTGVASASSQQKAFDAGVNNYLVKPVSLKDLKRLMNIQWGLWNVYICTCTKLVFFFFFRATETLLFRGLWIRLGQFVLRGLRIITNEVVLKIWYIYLGVHAYSMKSFPVSSFSATVKPLSIQPIPLPPR